MGNTITRSVMQPAQRTDSSEDTLSNTISTSESMPAQHKDCQENACRCYEFGIYDTADSSIDSFILYNISTETYTSPYDFLKQSEAGFHENPYWLSSIPGTGGYACGADASSHPDSHENPGASPAESMFNSRNDDINERHATFDDYAKSGPEELTFNSQLINVVNDHNARDGKTESEVEDVAERDEILNNPQPDNTEEHSDVYNDYEDPPYHPDAKTLPTPIYDETLEKSIGGFEPVIDLTTQPAPPASDASDEDDGNADYQPESEEDGSDVESDEYRPPSRAPRMSTKSVQPKRRSGHQARPSHSAARLPHSTSGKSLPKASSQRGSGGPRAPLRVTNGRKAQKKWTDQEAQALYRHMINLVDRNRALNHNQGEAIYDEAADLIAREGYERRERSSIKNKWSRDGRIFTKVDERIKARNKSLQTSIRKNKKVKEEAIPEHRQDIDNGTNLTDEEHGDAASEDANTPSIQGTKPTNAKKRKAHDNDKAHAGNEPKRATKTQLKGGENLEQTDDATPLMQIYKASGSQKRKARDGNDRFEGNKTPKRANRL